MNAHRIVFLTCAAFAATGARATPEFPGEIQSHITADVEPVCQVCHTDGGSSGSATQPLAVALKDRGLAPFDVASLHSALDELEADAVDSDGDGTGDVDELRAGTNPNAKEGGDTPPPPPPLKYGFGCTSTGPGGALWFGLAALGLAVGRIRRRGGPRGFAG